MMAEVRLSDVDLDAVSRNEYSTVFMPMEDYNREMEFLGLRTTDPGHEFDRRHNVAFSVFVDYRGENGILLFRYR